MGEVEVDEDYDDEGEPDEPITKSMWQRFRVLRAMLQKASLKKPPSAYTCGGEGGSVLAQQ